MLRAIPEDQEYRNLSVSQRPGVYPGGDLSRAQKLHAMALQLSPTITAEQAFLASKFLDRTLLLMGQDRKELPLPPFTEE